MSMWCSVCPRTPAAEFRHKLGRKKLDHGQNTVSSMPSYKVRIHCVSILSIQLYIVPVCYEFLHPPQQGDRKHRHCNGHRHFRLSCRASALSSSIAELKPANLVTALAGAKVAPTFIDCNISHVIVMGVSSFSST